MSDVVERLRAAKYTRERWVEPVGHLDEPCDADDLGAEKHLRNPDGPEAADEIERLRAENERLSREVLSGMLPKLLDEDETEELVKLVKHLRENAKAQAELNRGRHE